MAFNSMMALPWVEVLTKLALAFSLDTRMVAPQSKEGRYREDEEEIAEGEGGG
jgi:hypothetical protein